MGQIVVGIVCLVLGALIAYLATKERLRSDLTVSEKRATESVALLSAAREAMTRLDAEVKQLRAALEAEKIASTRSETSLVEERKRLVAERELLGEARTQLRDAFDALAADALSKNNQAFLELAGQKLSAIQKETIAEKDAVADLVKPIQEKLGKFDEEIRKLENARISAYGSLTQQVSSLKEGQDKLHNETATLVKALRSPTVRGRWGEIQLRRVVEIAGMVNYCDFSEQETVTAGDGKLRPDLIVRLPGGKNIVVDSKTPLSAYLDASETQDEEVRRAKLQAHAVQVRQHMVKLGAKAYWEHLQPTPEFVVMFLPGEAFFSEALAQDPSLIEEGVAQRVIVASPTTLISLLRAVAYGWQQQKIAQSAEAISQLGKELYERLRTMSGYFESVGKNLDSAVASYNRAVGSLENRVLVSARRFAELGTTVKEEIEVMEPIESTTRQLELTDWSSGFSLAAAAEEETKARSKGA